MRFVGHDEEKNRMEILELNDHPYFVATQYHPEYLSRPLKPSPPFLGLILASVGKLQNYLNHGCRLSPRQLSDESSEDETELLRSLSINTTKSVSQMNGHSSKALTNGLSHLNGNSTSGDETDKIN